MVSSPFVRQENPAHTFEFRFKNCFLWAESDTALRLSVRRGEDIYDNSKAVPPTFGQYFETINSFGPYLECITKHLQEQGQKKAPTRPSTAARTGTPSIPPEPQFDAMNGRLPTILRLDDTEDDGPDRDDISSSRDPSR